MERLWGAELATALERTRDADELVELAGAKTLAQRVDLGLRVFQHGRYGLADELCRAPALLLLLRDPGQTGRTLEHSFGHYRQQLLHHVALSGRVDVLRYACDEAVDDEDLKSGLRSFDRVVASEGESWRNHNPLMLACAAGHRPLIQGLLAEHRRLGVPTHLLGSLDDGGVDQGVSAFFVACAHRGDPDLARDLFQAAAAAGEDLEVDEGDNIEVGSRSDRHEPVLIAVARRPGSLPVVRFLVEEAKADVCRTIHDNYFNQFSALSVALDRGHLDTVAYLLQHGESWSNYPLVVRSEGKERKHQPAGAAEDLHGLVRGILTSATPDMLGDYLRDHGVTAADFVARAVLPGCRMAMGSRPLTPLGFVSRLRGRIDMFRFLARSSADLRRDLWDCRDFVACADVEVLRYLGRPPRSIELRQHPDSARVLEGLCEARRDADVEAFRYLREHLHVDFGRALSAAEQEFEPGDTLLHLTARRAGYRAPALLMQVVAFLVSCGLGMHQPNAAGGTPALLCLAIRFDSYNWRKREELLEHEDGWERLEALDFVDMLRHPLMQTLLHWDNVEGRGTSLVRHVARHRSPAYLAAVVAAFPDVAAAVASGEDLSPSPPGPVESSDVAATSPCTTQ